MCARRSTVALLLLFSIWAPAVAQDAARPAPLARSDYLERFNEIVEIINERFYDSNLLPQRLPAPALQEFRRQASASANLDEFANVVNEMLDRLETSHCSYWTNTSREFYELRAIFGRHGMRSDDKALRIPWLGFIATETGGDWYVQAVLERLQPTQGEGEILVGDKVLTLDGEPYDPVVAPARRVGQTVEIVLQRTPETEVTVRRRVELTHPVQPYVEDMIAGSRTIHRDGLRIGYCRFWWMGRPETYGAAFHAVFQLRDCDAIVVDLRDGWGGQPQDYYALFDRQSPVNLYSGPVAAIINDGTRSAKEVVALDFQKNGRGLLIGSKTRGAVMPSAGFPIGPDGLLVLAVARMRVREYAAIEGAGITPDLAVAFELPYAAGEDPQLAAAIDAVIRRIPKAARIKPTPVGELTVK